MNIETNCFPKRMAFYCQLINHHETATKHSILLRQWSFLLPKQIVLL